MDEIGLSIEQGLNFMLLRKRHICSVIVVALTSILLFLQPTTTTKSQVSIPTPANASAPIAGTIHKDGMGVEMVYVPEGQYTMGTDLESLKNLCLASSSPQDCLHDKQSSGILDNYNVKLPGFWIDRYEVTVKIYGTCVSDGVCDEIDLSTHPEFSKPRQPQVYVTWNEAVRLCNQRQARLPTEEEWEYAASSPKKFLYPWGNSVVKENFPGGDVTYEVGTLPKNISWVGAYDMAGNAAEWVENYYLPYNLNIKDWAGFSEYERVLRGSSWQNGTLYAATFMRVSANPLVRDTGNGFRCARYRDPEVND